MLLERTKEQFLCTTVNINISTTEKNISCDSVSQDLLKPSNQLVVGNIILFTGISPDSSDEGRTCLFNYCRFAANLLKHSSCVLKHNQLKKNILLKDNVVILQWKFCRFIGNLFLLLDKHWSIYLSENSLLQDYVVTFVI